MKYLKLFENWVNEKHTYSITPDVDYSVFRKTVDLLRMGASSVLIVPDEDLKKSLLVSKNRSSHAPLYFTGRIVIPDVNQKGLTSIIIHEYQHKTQHLIQDDFTKHTSETTRQYILSNRELGAFISQLYGVFRSIHVDEDLDNKIMSKLRTGDVDSIFLDLIPKKFLERRLYIYLFGAGDRDTDYWNLIIKEKIANIITEDLKELGRNFVSTYKKVYEYANLPIGEFDKDLLVSAIYKYGFIRCFTDNYETMFKKFKNSLYNEIRYENAKSNASIYVVNTKDFNEEIRVQDIKELDAETINKIEKFDSNIKIISIDELVSMNPEWKSQSESQKAENMRSLLSYGSWINYR
jgi:hypothetical protein